MQAGDVKHLLIRLLISVTLFAIRSRLNSDAEPPPAALTRGLPSTKASWVLHFQSKARSHQYVLWPFLFFQQIPIPQNCCVLIGQWAARPIVSLRCLLWPLDPPSPIHPVKQEFCSPAGNPPFLALEDLVSFLSGSPVSVIIAVKKTLIQGKTDVLLRRLCSFAVVISLSLLIPGVTARAPALLANESAVLHRCFSLRE